MPGVPYGVLADLWAVPAQLCSQYGKSRWHSRTTLSTIARLPSGSSASRSGAFRDGALSVGTGTAHGCTRRSVASTQAQRRCRDSYLTGCAILSPMHAIWFRAEYRPSPSVAPWRSLPHPAKSESLNLLSLFVSLCRAIRRVIPVPLLRRYRALEPRSARRMCNEGLDDSDCANNWDSARQGLKVHHCTQSVQATRLAPILRRDRIDN